MTNRQRKFLPGDRVEILEGAVLDGDYMTTAVTGLTLATVLEEADRLGLLVVLDVELEIPRLGWVSPAGGRGKERWYCYTRDVRAHVPEREAIHTFTDYDS
jgi:hypothetical protein